MAKKLPKLPSDWTWSSTETSFSGLAHSAEYKFGEDWARIGVYGGSLDIATSGIAKTVPGDVVKAVLKANEASL